MRFSLLAVTTALAQALLPALAEVNAAEASTTPARHGRLRRRLSSHVQRRMIERDDATQALTSLGGQQSTESGLVTTASATMPPAAESNGADGRMPLPSTSQPPRSTALPQPLPSPPPEPPSPAPRPLDTSISSALSTECMAYLTNLPMKENYRSCLPLSLLIFTSNSFKGLVSTAHKTGNYTHLNELLAYTNSPQPGDDQCDQTFADLFFEISDKKNCGNDVSQRVPVAVQARRGMGNYALMRTAAGLTNPDTGVYCYLEAVANDKPDDLYLWMLPGGTILPETSTPTCSKCSALLLNHLAEYSGNTKTLNTTVLGNAASTVNAKCGSGFVTVTAQVTNVDSGASPHLKTSTMVIGAFASFLYFWVILS